jgi:hypothetical protein
MGIKTLNSRNLRSEGTVDYTDKILYEANSWIVSVTI